MKLEETILGHLILQPDLLNDLDIDKDFFRDQTQRLVFRELKKGNSDISLITEKVNIEGIASYLAGLLEGIPRTKPQSLTRYINEVKKERLKNELIKLISTGARSNYFDHDKIQAIYQEIVNLDLSSEKKTTVLLSEVEPQPVEWLWENYFPLGRLSMLSGDPNDGKTFFALDLSARITRGAAWPDGEKVGNPGAVFYLTVEDQAADTLRPRIDSLGGDPSKITILKPESDDFICFAEKDGLQSFENSIKGIKDLRLCVIDPILDFSGKVNPNAPEQVRGLLSPLSKIAERQNIALLLISHLNKAQSMSALYRTGGSTGAWLGKCRAAFMIFRDQEDKHLRYFAPLKANLAPKDPDRWSFRIIEGRLEHKMITEDIEIDDYINPQLRAEARESTYAVNWLKEALDTGPVDSKDIREKAEEAGIPERTLYRAMRKLKINPKTEGFGKFKTSIWSLP